MVYMKLKDKVMLITGGAQGIGRAITLKAVEEGAAVVVADLDQAALTSLVDEIAKGEKRIVGIRTDVTRFDEVRELVRRTLVEYDRIDVLVNNVGWDEFHFFMETDETFWDKVISINFKSVLNCCRLVLEHMIEMKRGRVINISSDAGRAGSMGEAVYSGAKGAIIALTKSLAREMARYNITVNCVCPGPTDTPLFAKTSSEHPAAEKIMEMIVKSIPLGRIGKPEDIANLVAFLATDETGFITGQTISVSGGLTMN